MVSKISEGEQTFSTIENFILRTLLFRPFFDSLPPPPKSRGPRGSFFRKSPQGTDWGGGGGGGALLHTPPPPAPRGPPRGKPHTEIRKKIRRFFFFFVFSFFSIFSFSPFFHLFLPVSSGLSPPQPSIFPSLHFPFFPFSPKETRETK